MFMAIAYQGTYDYVAQLLLDINLMSSLSPVSFGFEPIGDRGVINLASALEHNESLEEIRHGYISSLFSNSVHAPNPEPKKHIFGIHMFLACPVQKWALKVSDDLLKC